MISFLNAQGIYYTFRKEGISIQFIEKNEFKRQTIKNEKDVTW